MGQVIESIKPTTVPLLFWDFRDGGDQRCAYRLTGGAIAGNQIKFALVPDEPALKGISLRDRYEVFPVRVRVRTFAKVMNDTILSVNAESTRLPEDGVTEPAVEHWVGHVFIVSPM